MDTGKKNIEGTVQRKMSLQDSISKGNPQSTEFMCLDVPLLEE